MKQKTISPVRSSVHYGVLYLYLNEHVLWELEDKNKRLSDLCLADPTCGSDFEFLMSRSIKTLYGFVLCCHSLPQQQCFIYICAHFK